MENRNTLPKSERLYLRSAIDELFAKGQSFTAFPYRVVYHLTAEPAADAKQARCAVMTIAPKKRFRHAVDRNRVKRLTREAYRTQKHALVETLTQQQRGMMVAFVFIDNTLPTLAQCQQAIGKALRRLVRTAAQPNAE